MVHCLDVNVAEYRLCCLPAPDLTVMHAYVDMQVDIFSQLIQDRELPGWTWQGMMYTPTLPLILPTVQT